MRRVVHDGEGHVIALRPSSGSSAADLGTVGAVEDDGGGGGVSTIRYQELYSRASGHLVRVTASRVDALANHSSPFGKTSSKVSSVLADPVTRLKLSLGPIRGLGPV